MTPVVAQLLLVDLEAVFASASVYAVLGYAVRVAALFAVGVIAVFLDRSEFDRVRLFQIGMAAPSLLLATMNGAQLSRSPVQPPPVVAVSVEPPPHVEDYDAGLRWPARSLREVAETAAARAVAEREHARLAEQEAERARLLAEGFVPDQPAPALPAGAHAADASVVEEVVRGVVGARPGASR